MICKNCDTKTIGPICHTCGQKSSIERLTLKRFLSQQLVKKYLYYDQNFTPTLKDVFVRPGTLAWNYIKGKRKRYFNLVSLLGIVITAYLFLEKNAPSEYASDGSTYDDFVTFIEEHFKEIFFINIPILAFYSRIIFNRLRLNIVEHGVTSLVVVIATGIIGVVGNALYGLGIAHYRRLALFPWWLDWLVNISDILLFVYIAFTYIQFTQDYYSLGGKIWRLAFMLLLTGLTWVILFFLTIVIWTRGDINSLQFIPMFVM